MTRTLPLTLFALLVLLSPISSVADDKTWTGQVDSDFLKAGNWDGGVPATDDDIAIIEGGANLPVMIPADLSNLSIGALHVGDFREAGSIVQNGGTIEIIADAVAAESFIGLSADGTSSLIMNGNATILYDEPFTDGDGLDNDGTGKDFDVGRSVPEGSLGLLELHDQAVLRISDDLKLADGDAGNSRLVMDGQSQITVGSGISVDGTTEILLRGNALLATGNSAGPGLSQVGRTNEGYLTLSTDIAGTSVVDISEQARLYARTLQQRDGASTITVKDQGQFHVFDLFENEMPSLGNATVTGSAQGPQRTSNVAQSPTAEMIIQLSDDAVMTIDSELDDSEWSGFALSGGTNRGANSDGGETLIEVSDRAMFSVAQDLHMTLGIGPDANSILKITGPDATVNVNGDLRMALDTFEEENLGTATLHAVIAADTHSSLTVGGTAAIANGNLVVELGDYTPVGGESYDLIVADSIDGGSFRQTSLPPLDAPLSWNLSIDGNRVNLSVLQPGDFNQNGMLDIADINMLVEESASGNNNLDFDVNNDDAVNGDDVRVWAKDLKKTWIGDSNLDREFNSNDLVVVFQAGKFEADQDANWAEGDWTGDLRFNSGDLVQAFQDGGFELGPPPAVSAVPEPASLLPMLLGIGMISMIRSTVRRTSIR